MNRRNFIGSSAGSALAPSVALAQSTSSRQAGRIEAVQIWRIEGRRQAPGGNKQHQVNPLHVYEEHRPKEYREPSTITLAEAKISALYIKIRTTTGLEGLYGPVDKEAAIVVDQQLRSFLIGKDALAVEKIWDQMHRSNRHSRSSHFMMAISAVDNALWDLQGRYYGAPVYRLLGGPTRNEIEAYGSCLGYSVEPDRIRARSLELKNAGFQCQKWFMAWGPGDGRVGLNKNIAMVRNLRETVGEDSDIMFDAYNGWNLDYALSWAKQVEKYQPRWIEEPFHVDKLESFVQLRHGTSIPVATGEHFYGRWDVHEFLKAGAISVVQSDPEWCGGVSELVKMCSIASVYDAQVIPHGHSIHAALHVVASQSPMVCPLVEFLVLKMGSYYYFEKSPPLPVKGKFTLTDKPGFGIELDDAKIEARTEMKWA